MATLNLTNNSPQGSRRELDFYPTPPDVTHALMGFLQEYENVDFSRFWIWEPACGGGAMSEVLKTYSKNVFSTDLRETGYGVGGTDFLTNQYDCDAIITNPPFNISEDFIRHSLTQSSMVAMVLKSQYWHAKKRVALFNDHPPAYVLPLSWRPDFLGEERKNKDKKNSPVMEVCWTVWISGNEDTRYRILSRK